MAISIVSSNINKSANTIEIYRGQSKTFEVTIVDDSGNPADLLGATLYFSVKRDLYDQTPIIRKTTATSLEAEILIPTTQGKARFYLVPTDTIVSDVGKYIFDIWVRLASGRVYPVVEPSEFNIKAGVTVF